jgi:hypothetical protein
MLEFFIMTQKKKENCWEFMKCGREPNGSNTDKLGICPASTAESYNNINKGINAGRFCWKTVGTLCLDIIKGTTALSIISCVQCPFFKKVREEEGKDFV